MYPSFSTQTAKVLAVAARSAAAGEGPRTERLLADSRLFELGLFFADAMRFIPVKFCFENRTIAETNGCDSLEFTPGATAIFAIQASPISNAAPRLDQFHRANLADDFELHSR